MYVFILVYKQTFFHLKYCRLAMKCLGKPAAESKVPDTQKLVDGRCQVHSLVTLVDLAVRSFPWFSPKLA